MKKGGSRCDKKKSVPFLCALCFCSPAVRNVQTSLWPSSVEFPSSLSHSYPRASVHSMGLAYEGLLLTSSFPSPFLSHLLKAAQAALFCNPFFPMSWISNYIICSSDIRYPCLSPVSPFVSFTWQMWSLWLSAAAVATPGKSCTASEETCSQRVVWLLFNYFQNQMWIWSEWGNQKPWVLMVLAIWICQHCRLFACFAQSRLA